MRLCRCVILLLAVPWLSGCLYHGRLTVKRTWFDWNLYRDHALTTDVYDARPMKSERVEVFRWLHLKGPGIVRSLPSPVELAGFDEESPAPPSGPEAVEPPGPLPVPPRGLPGRWPGERLPKGESPRKEQPERPVPPLPEVENLPPPPESTVRVTPNAPRELPAVEAVPVPVEEGETTSVGTDAAPRSARRESWIFRN